MRFVVEVAFERGPSRRHGEGFVTLGEASRFALRLAHDLGRTFVYPGRGFARTVKIHDGERVVLAIRVIRGGLSGPAYGEGPIDLM